MSNVISERTWDDAADMATDAPHEEVVEVRHLMVQEADVKDGTEPILVRTKDGEIVKRDVKSLGSVAREHLDIPDNAYNPENDRNR